MDVEGSYDLLPHAIKATHVDKFLIIAPCLVGGFLRISGAQIFLIGGMSMAIFTIGYEGINLEDFISLLSDNEIQTLIDIREYPLSRKPGFSKTILRTTVNLLGMEYIHIPELGCPKHIRNNYREDKDWGRYRVDFLAYLETQGHAVQSLAQRSESTNFALLCFEADYNFCHRSFVANAVSKITKEKVRHIQSLNFKIKNSDAQNFLFA